jgi:5,10-methylene-tetrahydrofolate dehydrogenase/methenyl tetrahydrofolate cyclohydrolase
LQGCIELLERSGVPISGKSACVVGRSNIVGTPAAMLLQRRDATVTVVHSRTPNGQEICSKADIVIAACGKAEMITGDWIKEGAVVIDVGINAVDVSCRAESMQYTTSTGYIKVLHKPLSIHALSLCKDISLSAAGFQSSLPGFILKLLHQLMTQMEHVCGTIQTEKTWNDATLQDSSKKLGYRLVGDVNFAEAKKKASKITPVPGGVGPMTIAMLMQNTLEGAQRTLSSGQ